MGTPHFRTLPLQVQASLLAAALRANPMGSTSLRRPFDDRDYVPLPARRLAGSAAPFPTAPAKEAS